MKNCKITLWNNSFYFLINVLGSHLIGKIEFTIFNAPHSYGELFHYHAQ